MKTLAIIILTIFSTPEEPTTFYVNYIKCDHFNKMEKTRGSVQILNGSLVVSVNNHYNYSGEITEHYQVDGFGKIDNTFMYFTEDSMIIVRGNELFWKTNQGEMVKFYIQDKK